MAPGESLFGQNGIPISDGRLLFCNPLFLERLWAPLGPQGLPQGPILDPQGAIWEPFWLPKCSCGTFFLPVTAFSDLTAAVVFVVWFSVLLVVKAAVVAAADACFFFCPTSLLTLPPLPFLSSLLSLWASDVLRHGPAECA